MDFVFSFPEVQFFRGSDMRAMMIDILFCFSREDSTSLYKQVWFFFSPITLTEFDKAKYLYTLLHKTAYIYLFNNPKTRGACRFILRKTKIINMLLNRIVSFSAHPWWGNIQAYKCIDHSVYIVASYMEVFPIKM